jgi:hypothetical protein
VVIFDFLGPDVFAAFPNAAQRKSRHSHVGKRHAPVSIPPCARKNGGSLKNKTFIVSNQWQVQRASSSISNVPLETAATQGAKPSLE